MADETPLSPVLTDPLPVPPTLADPANFDARGDAFVSALQDFQEQSNAQAQNVAHNAGVAYAAASLAVQRAASASESAAAAAAAVPAAAQAVAARDQAVPAAASAIDSARRAEAAAASIEDGPVTSVNGQTGVVDLTAELHSIALLF